MGSCYSLKSSQMPLPSQPSPSGSSHTSVASRKATVAPAAHKSKGFGFNHGKYTKPPATSNSNEISSCRSNGDALKVMPDKAQKVASSPQSRFGFRKPASVGKSKKSAASNENSNMVSKESKSAIVSGSVESLKSNDSKLSQNSQVKGVGLRGPVKTATSKKLTYTHKPSSYRPNDNTEWRMIDESESSHADNGSTEILSSKGQKGGLTVTEDAANANVPVVLDNRDSGGHSSTLTKDTVSRNDLNGNTQDTHSTKHSKGKGDTGSSKLQSRLKKPFVKSKTFSDAHGLKKEDVVVKNARNSAENMEKTGKGKNIAQSKTSFLRRGFFGRQKNSSIPAVGETIEKSSHVSDTHKPAEEVVGEEIKIVSGPCEVKTSQTVPQLSDKSDSTDTNSSEHAENVNHSDSDCSSSQTVKPSDGDVSEAPAVCSSIPESLKARLGKADIPKGVAPIAMLDSAETTSIGSINSDDLMLEMDIDLGEYDDDGQEELTGSRTSHSLIMRTRSIGSGHPRSRSSSHSESKMVKGSQAKQVENSGSAKGSHRDVAAEGEAEGIVGYRLGYGRAPRTAMSTAGLEKREQWYNRKNKGSTSREEAMEELQCLMGPSKTQTRRFPRPVDGKAVRPASFPNFSRQRSDSAPPTQDAVEEVAPPPKAHVFKPPRLPSITDDDKVTVDGFTYRQMSQDITALKTMLLRLKRVIQEDELGSPIAPPSWKNGLSLGGSQPGSPFARTGGFSFCDVGKEKDAEGSLQSVLKENEALKNQVEALRQKVEEQDRTIHLLQQQMTKYEQLGAVTSMPATSHREKVDNKPQTKPSSTENTSKQDKTRTLGSQGAKRSLDYQHMGSKTQAMRSCDQTMPQRARQTASTTIPECSFSGKQYITNLLADMDQQIQSDMNSLFQNILESPIDQEGLCTVNTLEEAVSKDSFDVQKEAENIFLEENETMKEKPKETVGHSDNEDTITEQETGDSFKVVQDLCCEVKEAEFLQEKKFFDEDNEDVKKEVPASLGNNVEKIMSKNGEIKGCGDTCGESEKDSAVLQSLKQSDKKGKSIPNKTSSIPRQTGLPKYVPKGKAESPTKEHTSRFFKIGSFKMALKSPIKIKSYSEA